GRQRVAARRIWRRGGILAWRVRLSRRGPGNGGAPLPAKHALPDRRGKLRAGHAIVARASLPLRGGDKGRVGSKGGWEEREGGGRKRGGGGKKGGGGRPLPSAAVSKRRAPVPHSSAARSGGECRTWTRLYPSLANPRHDRAIQSSGCEWLLSTLFDASLLTP